jgi:hypothetical protein
MILIYSYTNGSIMKKILIPFLLVILGSISACKKANDVINENTTKATTGSISGIALPVGIIKNIVITSGNDVTKTRQVSPDPTTGAFSLANVPKGEYLMDFSTDEYYTSPVILSLTIAAGVNKDIGTFTASKFKFWLSCDLDGQYQGWNIKATYNNSYLEIASMSLGGTPEDNFSLKTKYRLSIYLKGVSGPGTYSCNINSGSKIEYRGYKSILVSTQSTDSSGSVGTVEITDIDRVKRTIKGSFTATLTSTSPTANNARVITNGIIDTIY